MLSRPKSRGEILLQSSDPKIYPKIVSNYLTDQEDINSFLRIIRFGELENCLLYTSDYRRKRELLLNVYKEIVWIMYNETPRLQKKARIIIKCL